MIDPDLDKLLATLRLYREQIEEAIITLDRLMKGNSQKLAFPNWLKRSVPRTQNQPAVSYRSILAEIKRELAYVERTILHVERLVRKSKPTDIQRSSKRVSRARI